MNINVYYIFLELGYDVSIPVGECSKYDFILDIGKHLLKIQCKRPMVKDGHLDIEASTSKPSKTNLRKLECVEYTLHEVDYFAAYYEGICYLLPHTGERKSFRLRLDVPKSGIFTNVRWARDYEGKYIIDRLLDPETTSLRNTLDDVKSTIGCKQIESVDHKFRWITDGINNHRFYGDQIPEGFHIGRTTKSN